MTNDHASDSCCQLMKLVQPNPVSVDQFVKVSMTTNEGPVTVCLCVCAWDLQKSWVVVHAKTVSTLQQVKRGPHKQSSQNHFDNHAEPCWHQTLLSNYQSATINQCPHWSNLLRIRFCDASTVDVAQLRAALDGFISRITSLFVNRKADSVQGYTNFVTWKKNRWQIDQSVTVIDSHWQSTGSLNDFMKVHVTLRHCKCWSGR